MIRFQLCGFDYENEMRWMYRSELINLVNINFKSNGRKRTDLNHKLYDDKWKVRQSNEQKDSFCLISSVSSHKITANCSNARIYALRRYHFAKLRMRRDCENKKNSKKIQWLIVQTARLYFLFSFSSTVAAL